MKIEKIKANFDDSYQSIITPIVESLNQLCGRQATIDYEIADDNNFNSLLVDEDLPRVFISFSGNADVEWFHLLSLPPQLVVNIYAWMIGDEPGDELGDEHLEGLKEAANQIFGQVKTFLEVQDTKIEFENLQIEQIDDITDLPEQESEEDVLCANYKAEIDDETHSILHYYWTYEDLEEEKAATSPQPQTQAQPAGNSEPKVQVNPAEFENFQSDNDSNNGPRNLDMLMDVQLEAVVELGRKTIPIKDILKLGKGSIIELEKTAGESLDIFINGRKLAEGEVVVVDERFGIRITHLLEPKERIKSLQ